MLVCGRVARSPSCADFHCFSCLRRRSAPERRQRNHSTKARLWPSVHLAYLHAIEDVEIAYGDIAHRGGARNTRPHESAALNHLHTAADYLRTASQADVKNYRRLPLPDANANNKVALLHDALTYVDRAISGTSGAESDLNALPQQRMALAQLSELKSEINAAISDYEKDVHH